MQDNSSNNKRIAKNTVVLYGRMLVLMFVGLFTSRVVLNALGVQDFGINNVVGGFIGLFAIITQSMSSTISRYVTFELGMGNEQQLSKVFCTSVNIQILYALVVALLAETIGLWFVNTKLVIPDNRMFAANCLYQLSIISMMLSLVSVPYNACIVAHERMSAFAYITIYEGVAKLIVAYVLYLHLMDNLILFGLLTAGVSWSMRAIYLIYCKRHFSECHYHFILDWNLFRRMFGFAGWNLIGSSSAVLRDHGGNILINLFFGPSVNAAQGIASNVREKVTSFAGSFMTAMNPQITKSYAANDKDRLFSLLYQGARFSFFLMLIFAVPILVNTNYILNIWLGIVPEHTVIFIRLVLVFSMLEAISNPLVVAVKATERIRNYQIVVGSLQMLNLPLVYVFFRCGYAPEFLFIVAILIGHICLLARLVMLRKLIGLKSLHFLYHVYLNVVLVFISSIFLPMLIVTKMSEGLSCFVTTTIVSILSTLLSSYYIGCSSRERHFVLDKVNCLIASHRRKIF